MPKTHRAPALVTTFYDHLNRPVTKPPDATVVWRPSVCIFLVHEVDPEEFRLLVMKTRGREAWEVPGGGQELGERIQDAARRELNEETGYDVAIDGEPFGLNERFFTIKGGSGVKYCHGHVSAFSVFTAEVPEQSPDIAELLAKGLHPETAALNWMDLRRIKRSSIFPSQHKLFRAFFARYPNLRSSRGGW